MGVDVLLYAEGNPPAALVERAAEYFIDRSWVADRYINDKGEMIWDAIVHEPPCVWHTGRVVANVRTRYYGPGYERGDWPGIYGAIRIMQHLFRESQIFYGGDEADSGVEVTEEYLTKIWDHFLGEQGTAYFDRKRS